MGDNPFEEKNEPNPFQDPSVQATGGGGDGGFDNPFSAPEPAGGAFAPPSPVPPAPAVTSAYQNSAYESAPAPTSTFGAYDTGVPAYGGGNGAGGSSAYGDQPAQLNSYTAPVGSLTASGGGGVRAKELEDRERDLARREADLARRERELGGAQVKNWPFKFFAVAYHNIDEEIPETSRRAVHFAHYSFILLTVALSYNFLIAASAMFFTRGKFSAWLMAAIYLFFGVPGAYYLWYRRLYNACKNDSALMFAWFFLVYMFHILFCLYAMIAPSGLFGTATYSLAGIMSMISAFDEGENGGALGGVYAFGFVLFAMEVMLSTYAMRLVYGAFRGSGHTIAEARSQAAREGVSAAARV